MECAYAIYNKSTGKLAVFEHRPQVFWYKYIARKHLALLDFSSDFEVRRVAIYRLGTGKRRADAS